ncbi:MAG: hypothetical protein ACYDHZ_06525, partial [Dehalococcoidia bacterium]
MNGKFISAITSLIVILALVLPFSVYADNGNGTTNTENGVVVQPSGSSAAASSATTLSQYFSAQGETLPSLNNRAQMYQDAGLGSANSYMGT